MKKMNAKAVGAAALAGVMAVSMVPTAAFAEAAEGKTGTFHGEAQGFMGIIGADVTFEDGVITDVQFTDPGETEDRGALVLAAIGEEIIAQQSADVKVDASTGATITTEAVQQAVQQAIDAEAPAGEETTEAGALAFTAGTYTGVGTGYNGEVALDVTFSEDAITDIQINASKETKNIGTPAYDILFEDIKAANGTGVDVVSGATFTSRGVKEAVLDAATQAGATDLSAFQKNTVAHEAQAAIDETYDVVVVGAGGAGMAAAVQAAQNGMSVAVVEANAEIGGNTMASGGQYQSVQKYLVWDAADPDATTGEYEGETYDKVKMANGNVTVLKTILNWNEEAFDEHFFDGKEFVAGEISELSQAGVHEEFLPVLQALKAEIQEYLDWAQPQLDAGENENELTLFSTTNLHIFQTYYGGLRQNADKTEWIHGEVSLITQMIEDGQDLKGWLEDQGAVFDNATQPTIVGALWNRENDFLGSDIDGDGQIDEGGKSVFNTYIATTRNTLLNTVENAADNKIMTRTHADELIEEDGRVTGVKATMFDGTEVVLHANKGVVLATGGFAADIARVKETNEYWDPSYISDTTQTTNRSSLVGDGIDMGTAVGAATTGMEFTQMMPISWTDNGDLAFGGGNYAIYISPATGERFVNETSERDVLSLAEFKNGIEYNNTIGTFFDLANSNQKIQGPYPYGQATDEDLTLWESDVENRQYTRTVDQLDELFAQLGFECTGEQVRKTIEEYDMALMTGAEGDLDPTKTGWTALIGQADQDEKGNYLPETYTLDGVKLKIRLLAPSTHHTMGGLKIDDQRHVLAEDGSAIAGLYAAGEVTGGIHGGNRLGGNAIVDIFVSGRTAANAIAADAE